ncbi:MAG: class I SAM-dependent methyltransferase [Myxococcota bacterium]|nr:class I SAM-dependent methyltransferase [Myxococcota bacterium]
MLANRVRKNVKHLRKWAKRNQVTCYRIYDRDIPECPLAIDLYEDHLHIAEYSRYQNEDDPDGLIRTYTDAVAETLNIESDRVFLKTRRRQRGKSQYNVVDKQGHRLVVREGGLKFIVNLSDYLDTGLFLDHRLARRDIRDLSDGCRVLNLFAYTGSFTVYAAAGGAHSTTTVDLSNTYLRWFRDNLAINEMNDAAHEIVQADVGAWLLDAAHQKRRYDVIILDPPTFSNSKRSKSVLDLNRDHATLIKNSMSLLNPDGVLFFSTNSQRFKLEPSIGQFAEITETTHRTVPEDFKKRSHRSWRLEPK